LNNAISCPLASTAIPTISNGYCGYQFLGTLNPWPQDCFAITKYGNYSQYSSLLWMSWNETIILTTAQTSLTREVSTHFYVDISLTTTLEASSVNFGFPPSNTLIISSSITSLTYQVVDSSANFQVQITLITEKTVNIDSLYYNSELLSFIGSDYTNAGYNEQIFQLLINDTCELSGTYDFTANFQCYPDPSSCDSAFAKPTNFTLALTTNNVCPEISISPYTATALLNLYNSQGMATDTFDASDTTIVVDASIVVTPSGGPSIANVSVNQILINGNVLNPSDYTTDTTDSSAPSATIPMQYVLGYANQTGSNILQLVLFVQYGTQKRTTPVTTVVEYSTQKRTTPVTSQSRTPQRSVAQAGFYLQSGSTLTDSDPRNSSGPSKSSAFFVLFLCTIFLLLLSD